MISCSVKICKGAWSTGYTIVYVDLDYPPVDGNGTHSSACLQADCYGCGGALRVCYSSASAASAGSFGFPSSYPLIDHPYGSYITYYYGGHTFL